MSWFRWLPKSAQFAQILMRSWMQMISSLRPCSLHISSCRPDSLKFSIDCVRVLLLAVRSKCFASSFRWESDVTRTLALFLLVVFSASRIKAKFFGNYSAEGLRWHYVLPVWRRFRQLTCLLDKKNRLRFYWEDCSGTWCRRYGRTPGADGESYRAPSSTSFDKCCRLALRTTWSF